jgi:UDP-3-O-[3-hydroxymyristoyl] N-acetylglucosamine deacetylase
MNYAREFTIARPLSFTGIGVHSGKPCEVTLYPAEPGTGINFFKNGKKIPVNINNVESSPLCTKISAAGVSAGTVEHLLSALQGCGVTNTQIFIKGDEVPILDGSAAVFADLIIKELAEQDKEREFINLKNIVYLNENGKFMLVLPAPELSIEYFLDYGKAVPGFLFERFVYSPENYLEQIAKARTFGFFEDARHLKQQGLALGSSYDNTLVIGSDGYSTKLRYPNEPACHKVLDLIGDLAFLGKNIRAKIIAYKTGHLEHFQLIKKILQQA